MRLAANETRLKIGEATVRLRPSLRAAYQLLAGDDAILPLLNGARDFDTAIVSRIIRESATDEDEAEHFIAAILHTPGALASKSATISPDLIAHVFALMGIPVFGDEPAKTEPEDKQISYAEYLERLFAIGTGWLHWTPEVTWNATPAEILAAHEGHKSMLRQLYGSHEHSSNEPSSSEPHWERDEAGFAELKALAAKGDTKVRA